MPTDFEDATQLEKTIRTRHFKESEEGKLLTAQLIQYYKKAFPAIASYFVDGQIKYFIGKEISSLLGLKSEPFKDLLVKKMNTLKEWVNKNYTDKSSYEKMLKNHFRSKQRYKV